jgi:hypothetical protein
MHGCVALFFGFVTSYPVIDKYFSGDDSGMLVKFAMKVIKHYNEKY